MVAALVAFSAQAADSSAIEEVRRDIERMDLACLVVYEKYYCANYHRRNVEWMGKRGRIDPSQATLENFPFKVPAAVNYCHDGPRDEGIVGGSKEGLPFHCHESPPDHTH